MVKNIFCFLGFFIFLLLKHFKLAVCIFASNCFVKFYLFIFFLIFAFTEYMIDVFYAICSVSMISGSMRSRIAVVEVGIISVRLFFRFEFSNFTNKDSKKVKIMGEFSYIRLTKKVIIKNRVI